jgi:hypothetical protein
VKRSDVIRTILLAAAATVSLAATAHASVIIIPATADIFLASQPSGTTISGNFGSDTAPAASPVAFSVVAGATITALSTGTTSVDNGGCYADADGDVCYPDESGFGSATYKGPGDALVGVFLAPGTSDVASGPASLDYTDPTNRNLPSQSPALDQVFFIGDGLANGITTQQFVAPAGATQLFLGIADAYGANNDNVGYLSTTVTGATYVSGAGVVPEPAAWAFMVLGFGAVGSVMRRRSRASAATA